MIAWIDMTEACNNGEYAVAKGEAKFADNRGNMYLE